MDDGQDHAACLAAPTPLVSSCLPRSVRKICAISGTSGSSGFGSVSSEQIDNRTLLIGSAGDHWSFRMSRQIPPFALMLQW